LGGVVAAIGLVIDDAIVVVENIHTHMARGQSRREAVVKIFEHWPEDGFVRY
jgi:HAE1 family hydrophobic/amphiphilic exporter-1